MRLVSMLGRHPGPREGAAVLALVAVCSVLALVAASAARAATAQPQTGTTGAATSQSQSGATDFVPNRPPGPGAKDWHVGAIRPASPNPHDGIGIYRADELLKKDPNPDASPDMVQAQDQYYCATAMAAIAATPAGYVIGDCPSGTRMNRSYKSDFVSEGTGTYVYQGGYVYTPFDACGWVREDRMGYSAARSRTNCVTNSTDFHNDPAEYAYYANCAPQTCEDGTLIRVTQPGCAINANVKPWIPRWGESGPMRPLAQGQLVLWRYVTADDQYVMVRDPSAGLNASNGGWGFIYHGCFTSSDFANPDGHPPYYFRTSAR